MTSTTNSTARNNPHATGYTVKDATCARGGVFACIKNATESTDRVGSVALEFGYAISNTTFISVL